MNARLFLATAIVAGTVAAAMACTATAPQAVPQKTPPTAPKEARVMQVHAAPLAPTPTGVVMTSAPTFLAGAGHAAFPGMARMVDGTMKLVWREGSDHYVARDGAILSTTLDDVGRNPTPPVTVLAGGADYRDPSVALFGGREYLTYFTGSAANPAEGAFVSVDRGPDVRVDGGAPYAAISAPVVRLPDGRLGAAWYGKQVGETLDKAYMSWSSDGGQTWTTNRILNPGVGTPEPWLVVDGAKILFFARWGTTGIAVRTSMDSGATWDAPRLISQTVQMSGRPTVHLTQSGVQIMVYRAVPSKSAHLAYSLDHGVTWTVGVPIMTAPAGSPDGMTYAAMADTDLPGVARLVLGMEQADGSSLLYGTYLAVSVR